MAFKSISAAEAASLVKHGYNIGLSGFTPAGTAKAVTSEIAKISGSGTRKRKSFPNRHLYRSLYRRFM